MLERAARPTVGAVVGQKIRPGFVRASAAQQEYMAIMKASDREREVHKATLQDAKSIAHNNIVMAKESEGLEIPPEVSDKGVNTLLRTPSKGHFYVMRDTEGAVIAQLLITYEWSDWRAADIWWMQSVYVAAPYRRQGLFTELYKHAKAESEKAGACGLRLYADDNNTKAHKTYEAMGMSSHYKVFEDLNTDY